MALGDANGDGRLDVVAAHYGDNTAAVLLNTGTFLAASPAAAPPPDVALYPNPARAGFAVEVPPGAGSAPLEAVLLDPLGQVVRRRARRRRPLDRGNRRIGPRRVHVAAARRGVRRGQARGALLTAKGSGGTAPKASRRRWAPFAQGEPRALGKKVVAFFPLFRPWLLQNPCS